MVGSINFTAHVHLTIFISVLDTDLLFYGKTSLHVTWVMFCICSLLHRKLRKYCIFDKLQLNNAIGLVCLNNLTECILSAGKHSVTASTSEKNSEILK